MLDFLIHSSLYVTITTLFILVLKACMGHKLSGRWQVLIWLLLLLRVFMPDLPESRLSVFNVLPVENVAFVAPEQVARTDNIQPITEGNEEITHIAPEPNEEKTMTISRETLILWVWGFGAIGLLTYFLLIQWHHSRCLNRQDKILDAETLALLEDCKQVVGIRRKVTLVSGKGTPMLCGIFSPKILLPEGYSKAEKRDVFLHELCHLKNGDVAIIWLGILVLCLYWFNPVLWYAFFVLRRDIELWCDQRVLKFSDSKKDYAGLLLKTALPKNQFIPGTTSLQNGKRAVTQRIHYIAYFKSKKLWVIVGAVLALLLAVLCLTNGVGNSLAMSQKAIDDYGDYMVGSIMADIAYADDEKVVAYYGHAVFVYNYLENRMEQALDLSFLNIPAFQQGDYTLVGKVSADGRTMLLEPAGMADAIETYDTYLLNLETGKAKQVEEVKDFVPFEMRYGDTTERFPSMPLGWMSSHYVETKSDVYYLILKDGSTLRSVSLVKTERGSVEGEEFYLFNGGEKLLTKEGQRSDVLPEGAQVYVNSGIAWTAQFFSRQELESVGAKLPFDWEGGLSEFGLTLSDLEGVLIDAQIWEVEYADGTSSPWFFLYAGDRLVLWEDLKTRENERGLVPFLNELYNPSESALYQETKAFLEAEFMRTFGLHYKILGIELYSWVETKNEAEFMCSLIHSNFDKDPDTVGYIKELKEAGRMEDYHRLKNEYLMPQTANFQFKIEKTEKGLKLYENAAPKGTVWTPVAIDDYIGGGE